MELTDVVTVMLPRQLSRDSVRTLAEDIARGIAHPAPVLLVRGASAEAFCLGLSLEEAEDAPTQPFADILATLSDAPKATLAYVDAPAIGGGFGLVCSCDWVVATPAASFALPELLWGILPAMIWPAITARLGPNVARQWVVSAHARSAHDAWGAGVVDRLAGMGGEGGAPDESRPVSHDLARDVRMLRRLEPNALQAFRRWHRQAQQGALAEVIHRGASVTAGMLRATVARERIAAFTSGEAPWQ